MKNKQGKEIDLFTVLIKESMHELTLAFTDDFEEKEEVEECFLEFDTVKDFDFFIEGLHSFQESIKYEIEVRNNEVPID